MNKTLLHIAGSIFCIQLVLSQTASYPFLNSGAALDTNSALVQFERNVNTYLWNADIRYAFYDTSFFVNLSDNFRSVFINHPVRSFRDEQNFTMTAAKNISSKLSLAAEAKSFILSDNQTLGSSNAGIHTGGIGISYSPTPFISLTPLFGMRYDKQQRERDEGANVRLYALVDSLEFSGYRSQFSGRIHHSDLGKRYFKNDGAELNIATEFARGSSDSVTVRWLRMRNDFYVPADDSIRFHFGVASNIRARTEQQLRMQNVLLYNISDRFRIQLTTNVDSRTISNAFRYKYLRDVKSIPFTTTVEEFGLGGVLDMQYLSENFFSSLGFELSEWDEQHLLERIEGVDNTEQEKRAREEARLDNSAFRRTLRSNSMLKISPRNEILFNGSVSLLQYDTPDSTNTDDRDELFISASLREQHSFSHLFSMAVTAEVTLAHIVYLRSEKSGNNNWNRIFRLLPEMMYTPSKRFRMFNAFEVMANYTVFDFESLVPSVKSYSYRQVAFLDSTSYDISPKTGLDMFVYVRVFERGELRWKEFSERPLQRIEEVTFSPRLRYTYREQWLFAVGFRSFGQRKFKYEKNVKQFESAFVSVGPTVNIVVHLSPWSLIEIQGWKEFQRQSGRTIKEFSNVTMNVRFTL